jgi:hypothetical protein
VWEAFDAAKRHAMPLERLALAERYLHVLSLIAGYRFAGLAGNQQKSGVPPGWA